MLFIQPWWSLSNCGAICHLSSLVTEWQQVITLHRGISHHRSHTLPPDKPKEHFLWNPVPPLHLSQLKPGQMVLQLASSTTWSTRCAEFLKTQDWENDRQSLILKKAHLSPKRSNWCKSFAKSEPYRCSHTRLLSKTVNFNFPGTWKKLL